MPDPTAAALPPPPRATTAPAKPQGAALRQQRRLEFAIRERQHRLRALPPPGEAEVAAMVAAWRGRGGRVTVCPDAYAAPIHDGAGRRAEVKAG